MPTRRVPIGILISSEGSYSVVSGSMLSGALIAIDEVNASETAVRLDAVIADPSGQIARYYELADKMLAGGIKHVVGCYTSSSRKEIIPLFEKADALLWYPSHYEGFESSPNVVYTGPVANQHLLPLLDYMLRHVGRTTYCVGSNYIWAWENNRIMRETIGSVGGSVLAERYFPVGSSDFNQVIEAILVARPSFVFNTLIGVSSYHFLRDLRAACLARGIDQPATIPVASCTLSEPELQAIGPSAWDGHITASVYFSSIDSPENARFVSAYRRRHSGAPAASADAEAAYVAVHMLALALAKAGSSAVEAVKQAVADQGFDAPQGKVSIDPETMHARLTPRIGRSTANGQFDILLEAPAPLRADPYLIWSSSRFEAVASRPDLRIAS